MKVLVTGIAGFTGSHLADYLLSQGCVLFGTVFNKRMLKNISHIADKIHIVECNICDLPKLRKTVHDFAPDLVFHLAARTQERIVREDAKLTFETNVLGTMNLLEAVRAAQTEPVVMVPGSSAEFGLVKEDENPVKETNPYRPISNYAVSKIAQGMVAYQYYLTDRMKVIRTHTFNYIGARQSEEFVCSAFAKQVAEIEKGLKRPVIHVGNLDTKRDFTDVRDIVKAYWLAVRKGTPGQVYNICSGHAYCIREILEKLLSMSNCEIEVRQEAGRMRPSDVPVQIGDFSKFRKLTGWKPEITIEETLRHVLDYWRKNI